MGIHDNRDVPRVLAPEKTPEPNKLRIKKYERGIEKNLEPERKRKSNFTVMNDEHSYDYFEIPMYESAPKNDSFEVKEDFGVNWKKIGKSFEKVSNDTGDWFDENIIEPTEEFIAAADPTTWGKDIEKAFVKFGDMIKDAAEDTKDGFVDFGKDMKKDFTEFGYFWEDIFETMGDSIKESFSGVDDFFTEGIPRAFENAFEPVVSFFEDTLPDVFTKTIPEAFDPVKEFFEEDLPETFVGIFGPDGPIASSFKPEGVVGEFFTQTIPNVFVNDVGGPLKLFFTETLPKTLETFFVTTIGSNVSNFFVNTAGPQLKTFFVTTIGENVSSFFTNTVIPELTKVFTSIIPGFFGTIWDYIVKSFNTGASSIYIYLIYFTLGYLILPPFFSELIKKIFSYI
jgi:hypothetical protein